MKFSERLINLRKAKGMSQEDLAQKLNVTRQTVSKWELDKTTPEMSKLIEISKLFEITLDELINNIESNTKEDIYIESSLEKNNKKISVIVLIFGIIISLVLCGVGIIKQNNAKKTNERLYNEAYVLSQKKYNAAVERINNINGELRELNLQKGNKENESNSIVLGSDKWFSEKTKLLTEISELNTKIAKLEAEKEVLENADYKVYYNIVEPIKYNIFYYIAAGVFGIFILIALIYFLVTRRK